MRQKGKVWGPHIAVVKDIILWCLVNVFLYFVGTKILWNVSNLSPTGTMSQPKELNPQSRELYIKHTDAPTVHL